MAGPQIRTDIVEVYVFRCSGVHARVAGVEFLQLRRAQGALAGTWQPVMGHVEAGETAVQAALRELKEETGWEPGSGLQRFWQLESVNVYFLATHDAVMLSPGFAALVGADAQPRLDDSHDAARWVARDHADGQFLWPGQRAAVGQIVNDIATAAVNPKTCSEEKMSPDHSYDCGRDGAESTKPPYLLTQSQILEIDLRSLEGDG